MTLSIRLSDQEARELAALARKTGRSKSEVVREAFRRSRLAGRNEKRQKALAFAGTLSGPPDLSSREYPNFSPLTG